jgi:hypothetical protein
LEILPQSLQPGDAESIGLSPPPFDSRIISDIPDVFAKFQEKQFPFLWRAGRDGFTPLKRKSRMWNRKTEIRSNTRKVDASLISFFHIEESTGDSRTES